MLGVSGPVPKTHDPEMLLCGHDKALSPLPAPTHGRLVLQVSD